MNDFPDVAHSHSGSERARGLRGWLNDRAGLHRLFGFTREQALKPVPRNLSWAYTLGTLALFYFGLQLFTGILLLVHYAPHEDVAYQTVQTIQHRVQLGWLFRQMHSWGASFVVIVLCFHMLKVLWYGSYKRPREFTWFVGVLLLGLTLAFCFTGYILPWNQLAKWATAVGTDAVGKVPGGTVIKQLILGGSTVSGETLGRFFAAHVILLPALLLILVLAHLVLIRWKGITPKTTVREEVRLGYDGALAKTGAEPFFPRQVYRETLVMVLGFAVLVTVATFFPFELGVPASSETPPGIKPEWYFLPVYQALKYFDHDLVAAIPLVRSWEVDPELFGIVCINLFALAVLFLPILDRGKQRRITRRPFFALIALVSIVVVVGLGLLGYVADRSFTVFGKTYAFDIKGFPVAAAENEAGGAEGTTGDDAAPAAGAETDDDSGSDENGETGASQEAEQETESESGGTGEARGEESTGSDSAGAVAAGSGDAPPAFVRPDGREPGGTCVDCHRRQHRAWSDSVHAAANPPVECVACHGGIDTSEIMLVAHQGMPTVADDPEPIEPEAEVIEFVEVRPPEGEEVIDVCGSCHSGVEMAFSPRHREASPSRECADCHSNHDVEPAGLATYEVFRAYKEGDPRYESFAAIRNVRRAWLEKEWPELREAIGEDLAFLREHEFPTGSLEDELETAALADSQIGMAMHSLDVENVRDATAEARTQLETVHDAAEEVRAKIDDRWKFVAGTWVVTLLCAAWLVWRLRRLRIDDAAAGTTALQDDGDDGSAAAPLADDGAARELLWEEIDDESGTVEEYPPQERQARPLPDDDTLESFAQDFATADAELEDEAARDLESIGGAAGVELANLDLQEVWRRKRFGEENESSAREPQDGDTAEGTIVGEATTGEAGAGHAGEEENGDALDASEEALHAPAGLPGQEVAPADSDDEAATTASSEREPTAGDTPDEDRPPIAEPVLDKPAIDEDREPRASTDDEAEEERAKREERAVNDAGKDSDREERQGPERRPESD